ncbi:MAG: hydroxymethylpyrimidine/phosphomethylpyrimidine kinase [Planctomycetes bacterium]|nr:hydroxymethylpyrimidine/phosphomethylpyrimidine kinase [Planctomycetota bacterium]
MKLALTIAGSDPTGAAGLEADLRVFQSLGLHGMAVATALTVQDSGRVHEAGVLDADLVLRRLDVLLADLVPDLVKVGMLGSADIVAGLAPRLASLPKGTPIVVDPVLASSSGRPLLEPAGLVRLRDEILPLARAICPNRREAALLLGREDEPAALARDLARFGPRLVVVTGGDAAEPMVRDFVCSDGELIELTAERLPGPSPHGTGCTFASALAAHLLEGRGAVEAVRRARDYARSAIAGARTLSRGGGRPLPRLKGVDDDD